MTVPTSTESADHYTWGGSAGVACDGWHLVRAVGLSVIQERMPPGAAEVRHRHARSRQFFFVLAGRLDLEVEGVVHALPAGTGVEVAPGSAHQALNRGAVPVDFLVVSQPPSHGDRETVTSNERGAPPAPSAVPPP